MKYMLSICLCLSTIVTFSQPVFKVVKDSVTNENMLVGAVQKSDLSQNPEFKWYAESQKIYPTPNAEAVAALKANKDKIYLVIFAGTWCEDTHFVLPKFYKIQEASGFPESRIALFALDRNKKMADPIAEALDVKDVPTIIVMRDGKEIGRVVEYGKTGYWDNELADIISAK